MNSTLVSTRASAISASGKKKLVTIAGIVVLPLALVLLWQTMPLDEYMRETVRWIESTGPVGVIAFYLVYVVCALVGLPRTLFNIAAGVLFSYPVALVTVLVAAASAYAATFTIARTFAREWVLRRVAKLPNVERILKLVEQEGFKLVFLIRLNPFIPGVLKGYGLGTTKIPFGTYLAASILGFLPIALAHVYLGWVGGEAMLNPDSHPTELQQWLLYGGVVASVILVAIFVAYGRRAMNRRFGD